MEILNSIKTHKIKILIIFSVFLVFLANYIGLFELNIISGPKVSLHSKFLRLTELLTNRHIFSYEVFIYIVLGIFLSVLLPVLSPLKAIILTTITLMIPVFIDHQFLSGSTLLPLEYTLLTIVILYLINVLLNYYTEVRTKQMILNIFQYYIPPQIVNEIAKNPGQFSMDGEAKEMTVLFCDIRNFTEISEQLNPKQITTLLNDYFTTLSRVLYEYEATIDKYIGDAVMAFWGAPVACEDHAQKSVQAALKMHEATSRISDDFVNEGKTDTDVGFGINTGIMNVGNMGSTYRVAYTVIGDAVNLASRIEQLTRFYRVPIIVNETTMQQTDNLTYRELDKVIVKGKSEETRLFQPIGLTDEISSEYLKQLDRHAEGIKNYYDKNWDIAENIFRELKTHTDDEYYDVMLEKIKILGSSH